MRWTSCCYCFVHVSAAVAVICCKWERRKIKQPDATVSWNPAVRMLFQSINEVNYLLLLCSCSSAAVAVICRIDVTVVIRFRPVLLLEKRSEDQAKNPVLFTFCFRYILVVSFTFCFGYFLVVLFCFILSFSYGEIVASVCLALLLVSISYGLNQVCKCAFILQHHVITRLIHQRVRMICHRFYQRISITCIVHKYLQYFTMIIVFSPMRTLCIRNGVESSRVVSDLSSTMGSNPSTVYFHIIVLQPSASWDHWDHWDHNVFR